MLSRRCAVCFKALPAGAGCPGEDTWAYMGFGLCRGRCLGFPARVARWCSCRSKLKLGRLAPAAQARTPGPTWNWRLS